MKRILCVYGTLTFIALLAVGATYAAFSDLGKVTGSTFSVGSADIKLLVNLNGGTDPANLVDELPGPSFSNITPFWTQDHLMKIYNNAGTMINLTTNSNYVTANDPDDLRSIIFVELLEWDDVDNDGILDSGEVGFSFGRKTIVKWKTEGFDLGDVGAGNMKGLVLRFSTDDVSSTKQGKSGLFDFEFDATSL